MKLLKIKPREIKRVHHLLSARGVVLGRLASQAAELLMGKNKPYFVRNLDVGDFVTINNAGEILTTGHKEEQKLYRRHSGYPGGFREIKLKDLKAKHPDRIIRFAVAGMLPKNKLRAKMLKRLAVTI